MKFANELFSAINAESPLIMANKNKYQMKHTKPRNKVNPNPLYIPLNNPCSL